jgi:hypothetical protein
VHRGKNSSIRIQTLTHTHFRRIGNQQQKPKCSRSFKHLQPYNPPIATMMIVTIAVLMTGKRMEVGKKKDHMKVAG